MHPRGTTQHQNPGIRNLHLNQSQLNQSQLTVPQAGNVIRATFKQSPLLMLISKRAGISRDMCCAVMCCECDGIGRVKDLWSCTEKQRTPHCMLLLGFAVNPLLHHPPPCCAVSCCDMLCAPGWFA